MFKGRNIIGLLNLSGSIERLLLRPRRPDNRASIVAGQDISPRNADSHAVSTPPHSLLRVKVQAKLIRRRRERSRLDASTTCRFLKILPAHQLWRVCSSPMATLSLYSLIQEHHILLSVQPV